eukprot:TRINITY_DN2148_c0_g2_i2.p1 TRINITY_DN2148_c0_g2~~TRINITY_DN2148_c0_g2_i2.p1  ORF type:complete len:212 (+),score=54.04 TRINITY_DN2148_c0_g2_i2:226-861(+)
MSWFSKPKPKEPTPKDIVRTNKRVVRKSQRDLETEIRALDRQEKQVQLEIKKLARANQMSSARMLAKEIVRIRAQRDKLLQTKIKLNTINTKTTQMKANMTLQKSMAGATYAMQLANSKQDVQNIHNTMAEYQRQNEMIEMKEEMIDDLLEGDEDEEEANEIVDKVFDEIGLDIEEQLVSAPKTALRPKVGTKQTQRTAEDDEVDKLLEGL